MLRCKIIIIMTSIVFFACVDQLIGQNKTIIGLGGGISKAAGDDSKYWNIGFNFGGELFQKVSENILIGGRVAYNRWGPNEDELKKLYSGSGFPGMSGHSLDVSGSSSIIELLPSIRLVSSTNQDQKTQFFGQIGAGYYILKIESEASTSYNGNSAWASFNSPESTFGINFGAGIIIASSGNTKYSIYPMYNIIFTEEESTKYFTINLGILFGN